ncbi:MAG: PqqD family protein [Magnetococcales bacterium]|nr:PqqD family protein [Magnetococcales bacterium]
MPDSCPTLPPSRTDMERLFGLAVSRNGFVFDPVSGQSFTVNATGLATLELLQRGASVQETARQVSEIYSVAWEVALSAVEGFIRQLADVLP